MKMLLCYLLIFYFVLPATRISANELKSQTDSENMALKPEAPTSVNDSTKVVVKDELRLEQEPTESTTNVQAARSIAGNYEVGDEYAQEDHHAAFKKRAKPLKNIFMGIYKNYKSTYLGNKTSLEYKQRLRERFSAVSGITAVNSDETTAAIDMETVKIKDNAADKDESNMAESETTEMMTSTEQMAIDTNISNQEHDSNSSVDERPETAEESEPQSSTTTKKRRKRKRKNRTGNKQAKTRKHLKTVNATTSTITPEAPTAGTTAKDVSITLKNTEKPEANDVYRYNVGPGFNMSLDMNNELVNVQLNANNLREIFTGRWLSDNSEEGRGKKYDMITRVLPLFILPFLIQSAVVPFLVTKLKLLLMKSILVGKLAIFLLIISAIKNNNKGMQSYEVAPSYWAAEPSRRSEFAAAATAAYNGYRVEGKPTAWIN